jgi:AmmeMemoRadiSam system protein A/AmmeMemoRadiSam system protein B
MMALLGGFIVPHPPLIIPEIGRGQEKAVQSTISAFHMAAQMIAELKPDTIVITTPHSVLYADYVHISPGSGASGDFGRFGHPEVHLDAAYDREFVEHLVSLCETKEISAGTMGERDPRLDHGSMIPLYFIDQYYHNYKIVRISISGLPFLTHYQFGKLIAQAAADLKRRVVVVASGDLSHKLTHDGPYGFTEEGPCFDKQVTEAMQTGNFGEFLKFDERFCRDAAECGLRSFIILAGALDGLAVEPQLLSYEGPYGVGYAVAAYQVVGRDPQRRFDQILRVDSEGEDEYVRLARMSLEHYVKHRSILPRPEGLSSELVRSRAGVFVSLHIGGQLRGCIGTIKPAAACVADEIIRNAVSAGREDPRFPPVRVDELPYLEYSVDVLGEEEPVSSPAELDPKRYGVIVSSGGRRGLLLPNLDGVDTVAQQLGIALQKAGIAPNEQYQIARFEVVRHQ